MIINNIISEQTIILNLRSTQKEDVIDELIQNLVFSNIIKPENTSVFSSLIWEREKIYSTAIGKGIAIPHGISSTIQQPTVIIARSLDGVDFDSIDKQPVHLIFMIALPEHSSHQHLELIAQISKLLTQDSLKQQLLDAKSKKEIIDIMMKSPEKKAKINDNAPLIVAVTGCATGIAHTYMAEQELINSAHQAGYDIKVETHGNVGVKNALSQYDIERAIGVIIASDINIDHTRFENKKIVDVRVSEGIHNADELIRNITTRPTNPEKDKTNISKYGLYKNLLSGFSQMIPFAMAGGAMITLSVGITYLVSTMNFSEKTISILEISYSYIYLVGFIAFELMLPVISGYTAFSIADRPAMVVGFIAGSISSVSGAGVIGAIFAGYAAGYMTILVEKKLRYLPTSLTPLKDVFFSPLLGILSVSLVIFLVNTPLQYINVFFVNNLQNFTGFHAGVIGIVIAFMMSYDLGGPINKLVYIMGVSMLTSTWRTGGSAVMTAVMVSGMIPPLSIFISTALFKSKFTKTEKEEGKKSLVSGLSFISEVAIPFAREYPTVMKPAFVIGSSISSILILFYDIKILIPHGGMFAFIFTTNPILYVFITLFGAIISALVIGTLKQ